jgi:hypothetical protein
MGKLPKLILFFANEKKIFLALKNTLILGMAQYRRLASGAGQGYKIYISLKNK